MATDLLTLGQSDIQEAIERLEKAIWGLPHKEQFIVYDKEEKAHKRIGVDDLTTLIESHEELLAEVEIGRAVKEKIGEVIRDIQSSIAAGAHRDSTLYLTNIIIDLKAALLNDTPESENENE